MKVWPAAVVVVSALLLAGGVAEAQPAPVRMGVVLKALDNPFFVAMYEGVRAEAVRRGARTLIRAPSSSDDLAGQAAQARALFSGKQDCYVANPISSTNLIAALRKAKKPIVNVDSPINLVAAKRAGIRIRTFIGTNDFAAGRLAGAKMVSLLKGKGAVALLAGVAGSVNSRLRLSGFERGIRGSQLRVVARVTANYRRDTAELAAERLLHAHANLSGFFAVNDLMALGVADAVRTAGRTGKLKIVGVDGIAEALDAIDDGTISATISQYPYVMGRMAVEACIAAAHGAKLPRRVDAPVAVVTASNVGRASAAFPRPFRQYADPFGRLLR